MPTEQSDNTRVVQSRPRQNTSKQSSKQNQQQNVQPDQLYDTDKVRRYQNMQNFYNSNFFGYGIGGKQTNYNPTTKQGQAAIQANFNYAKENAKNFVSSLATAGITEGVDQVVKWVTTPVKIGQGAEAVVQSAPLSAQVTKVTTIPRSEMHTRNMVPGALKSRFVSSAKGLNTYTQPKVRILSKEQLSKASKTLEKIMTKRGWRKITHPNLQEVGYTNGQWVASDLGPGNIGRDWLGRLRLVDFSLESKPVFMLAMQKRGGKIINNN